MELILPIGRCAAGSAWYHVQHTARALANALCGATCGCLLDRPNQMTGPKMMFQYCKLACNRAARVAACSSCFIVAW